jgi:tRNA 5-methylaminomethyl-2-thiouridine biosynthesis bifunctional protein
MNGPLEPARIGFSDAAAPCSLDYDDVYHARGGAFEQARHVFLAGNGLPQRWARRARFVILETGFGLGNNFLATWAAWRDDPERCEQLWFLSIDKHPPAAADLQRAHAASPEPRLAQTLIAAWPPATPDLHLRHFAEGRMHLLLAFGDIAFWLPQWLAEVDAFFLDGFAPAKNPSMWQPHVLTRLGRLAAVGATAATWSSARVVRDALAAADFAVGRSEGFDGKREMLAARHEPRHRAVKPPGRRFGASHRSVAIVGAGLAGAAVAAALSRQGVHSTVFEAAADVAQGGSSQAAGLLHGVVHADDTPHTRWFRAAALHAAATIAPLIEQGRVVGRLGGALRLEHKMTVDAMQQLLQQRGLPSDYVSALSQQAAAQRAGCAVTGPAWWYGGGGWVEPRSLVHAWLEHDLVSLRLGAKVACLLSTDSDEWQLFDDPGRMLGTFDAVVLANADDALRLAATSGDTALNFQLSRSRGQTSVLRAQAPAAWLPAVPIAGAGYAVTLPDGSLLCGATSDFDDDDLQLRAADHRRNLQSLQALSGQPLLMQAADLEGRVGWRVHTRDRLPLLGAVPLPFDATAHCQDQPRFIARRQGLFVLTALGSRGLSQAPLGGEIVASMITGAPLPVGAPLLDAVDAARFVARAVRIQPALGRSRGG